MSESDVIILASSEDENEDDEWKVTINKKVKRNSNGDVKIPQDSNASSSGGKKRIALTSLSGPSDKIPRVSCQDKQQEFPFVRKCEVEERSSSPSDDLRQRSLKEFEKFKAVCLAAFRTSDMKKVLEKTDEKFKNADEEYTNSEAFFDLMKSKSNLITKNPQDIYVYIKDVVDMLKLSRKCKVKKKKEKTSTSSSSDSSILKNKSSLKGDLCPDVDPLCRPSTSGVVNDVPVKEEDSETNTVDKRKKASNKHLKKLYKMLLATDRKIRKLEQRDCNWSDEEDSVFLQEDRYKKRYVKIYEKICELEGKTKDTGRFIDSSIKFTGTGSASLFKDGFAAGAGTRIPEVNKCIAKFLKKTKVFPDFPDILKLVKAVSVEKSLQLTYEDVHRISVEAFKEVAELLRQRRTADFWDTFSSSYVPDDIDWNDPAENDEELQEKLAKNYNSNWEAEVFDFYAEKQKTENVDTKEPSDGEGDKSELQSSEEEEEEKEEEEKIEDMEVDEMSDGSSSVEFVVQRFKDAEVISLSEDDDFEDKDEKVREVNIPDNKSERDDDSPRETPESREAPEEDEVKEEPPSSSVKTQDESEKPSTLITETVDVEDDIESDSSTATVIRISNSIDERVQNTKTENSSKKINHESQNRKSGQRPETSTLKILNSFSLREKRKPKKFDINTCHDRPEIIEPKVSDFVPPLNSYSYNASVVNERTSYSVNGNDLGSVINDWGCHFLTPSNDEEVIVLDD